MADNYIEKQQERYEAQRLAWNNAQKTNFRKKEVHKYRIFITGGAKGIGKSIVELFVKDGWRVAFCDIDDAAGRALAKKTGATFFPFDIINTEALENCFKQLFEAWGDIDAIINNVGIGNFKPITETTNADFDHILSVNLKPVFATARLLALHRKTLPTANPYGRIINISSTRSFMSEANSEGYAASKGGINALTHALAISLSEWNITVNAISPGWIETGDYSTLKDEDHEQHPSKRVGRPEDIARMSLFLCQKENNFINGENITIDGGMTKKMIYLP